MFAQLFAKSGLSMERLRTLCEVAQAGGIAKAAPRDPDRQSLFSRQIKELEAFFGAELFRREGRGLTITPLGDKIAQAARQHFRELEDILANTRPASAEFHIVAGNSILEWIVIPRLARLRETLPDIRFRFSDMRSAEIIEALRDHRADFGIVRANAVVHPLKSTLLGKVGYRVFAPQGAKSLKVISMPWALPSGMDFREEIHQAALAAKIRLEPLFNCQSFGQCAALVRQGAAVAILPDFAAPFMAGLPSSRPDWLADCDREIALVWRDRLQEFRPMASQVTAALLAGSIQG